MARRLRVQFPGALYHVMNRGDRREAIFLDDADRARFMETLGETCVKTGWQVHAFVLMPNHFHLVVETPEANLMAGMKWLLGTYTARFNRRHGMAGHLFGGRYKATLVGGKGGYLRTVVDYVHLNPVRGGLLEVSRPLREFKWSSLPLFLAPPGKRPAWLRVDRALGECGVTADSAAGRGDFERRLEARRGEELDKEFQEVRHGWCLGSEDFRRDVLKHSEKSVGLNHYGPEVHGTEEEKAERLVRKELERLDWSEEELRTRPKGDPLKLAAAMRLRAETTMTLGWVAERLRMGTRSYLAHLVYWKRKGMRPPKRVRAGVRAQGPSRLARMQLRVPELPPETETRANPLADSAPFDTSFD